MQEDTVIDIKALPSSMQGVFDPPVADNVSPSLEDNYNPHLNSENYRRMPLDRTITLFKVWEAITMNDEKEIIIGTNKLHGREWKCSFYGFDDYKNIEPNNSKFKFQELSILSKMEYLPNKVLIAAFRDGGVQLWSTYSEVRNAEQSHCSYIISKKYGHNGPVECLEIMGPQKTKAITGGQDCSLKIWDFGEADLTMSLSYRYAHLDSIKGIASMQSDNQIFTTCGKDKAVLLWDIRDARPAHALYEHHCVDFQCLIWNNSFDGPNDTYLFVGDQIGNIHTIDKRVLKKFVSTAKVSPRAIRKLSLNGDKMAIVEDTNFVRVYITSTGKVEHEHSLHGSFVRDCVWYDETKLLTVGCDSKMYELDVAPK